MSDQNKPGFPRRALALDGLAQDALLGVAGGLGTIPYLGGFLGGRSTAPLHEDCAAALGWGRKRSGALAQAFARRTGRPALLLEDGFLRSVGLGKLGAASVSLVIDDEGIYYDSSAPSRLENLLKARAAHGVGVDSGVAEALARWQGERLSKYNTGVDAPVPAARGRIVLVDQVLGDLSVAGAGAGEADFHRMIDLARDRGVLDRVAIRTHPDVIAGKARGHFDVHRLGLPMIDAHCTAPALLDEAAEIWTVSSALGFEALLRGVPVTTFGLPFYAGWGLTTDLAEGERASQVFARRLTGLTREGLFGAALLDYPRYCDPVGGQPIDFHGAVDRIVDWRSRDRALAGAPLAVFGVSGWKRGPVAAMLGGASRKVSFHGAPSPRKLKALPADSQPAVWGMSETMAFRAAVTARGQTLHRIEDGFLRSVGLGSDFYAPGSLVLDEDHLYFDARGPSLLERILAETVFDPPLLARARALQAAIVAAGVTKYNLDSSPPDLRALAGGRAVVIVAAQVPDDAAIRFGGGTVGPNLDLLRAVRRLRPDAFLVYKDHPDLVSGNRSGRVTAAPEADLVLTGGDLAGLYPQCDELHVISSLGGFEALLRGVRVVTWGVPFYAGWGLTEDRAEIPRRTRKLPLEALVAGALILYPRYADPVSSTPCSPEDFLGVLTRLRAAPPQQLRKPSVWGKLKRLFR